MQGNFDNKMMNEKETPKQRGKSCSCFSFLGGGILLLLGLVGIYFVLWAMGAFLIIADPEKNVDAAVALSGGELGPGAGSGPVV